MTQTIDIKFDIPKSIITFENNSFEINADRIQIWGEHSKEGGKDSPFIEFYYLTESAFLKDKPIVNEIINKVGTKFEEHIPENIELFEDSKIKPEWVYVIGINKFYKISF